MDTLPPAQPSHPRSLDGVVPATTLSPHTHTHTPLNSPARSSLAEPGSPPPHRFRWPKRSLLLGFSIATIAILFAGGAYALFLGGTSGTNPSTSINLQKGLVGYWQLNGNAKDSTPYSNNGTVNNATPTTGPQGQANGAYSFNGTTADITMAKNVTLGTGTTIGLWVKTTFSSSQAPFVSNRQGSPSGSIYFGISLGHLFLYDNGASPAGYTSTGTIIDDGNWHYVAVTMTGTTTTLYIDGVSTAKSMTTNSTIGALQFGHDASTGNYFPGSIAQVRIYNRALNPNEVTALYNEAGNGINTDTAEAGLVGEWKLNGNAKDSTPYSNNGTLVNAPTPTTGPQGQANGAYSFNGTSNDIEINNSAALQNAPANQWTMSAWIYPTGTGTGDIIRKNASGSGYFLRLAGSSLSSLFHWSNGTYTVETGGTVPLNQWSLVTATYDGTTMRNYINGNLVGSWVQNETLSFSSDPVYIGAAVPITGEFFKGSISDVRIYNQALTATQISNLYTSGTSQINLDVGGTNNPAQNINLTQGLVGYWPFNDNAKDATPYSDNGIVNGATLTTDRFGNANSAYSFNGAGNDIDLGTAPALGLTGDMSITCWMYINNYQYNGIISKTLSNVPAPFDFYGLGNGIVSFLRGSGYTYGSVESANPIPKGSWQFVAVTMAGTAVTFYLNGATNGTGTISTTIANSSTAHAIIGSRSDGVTKMNGSLDDIRVYNRALSAAEVSALYSED